MTDDDTRPSWLHEPCPSWCVQAHTEEDHPDDRRHRGAGVVIPAVLAEFGPQPGPGTGTELVVTIDRELGDAETWLFIGEAEGARHRLRLSTDSARRVAAAIGAACATTQG